MLSKDILKEFVFECEIRRLSERTIKSYKNNNGLFLTFCEKEFNVTEIEKINHLHIKKYFQLLLNKGLAETYINSILKCMTVFFKYSKQEDYIEKNPCKKVSWQKEPKIIINTFTDDEVIKMMKVFDYSNYLNARNKTIFM